MPADGARRFNGQVLASANASSSLAQSHPVSAGVPCCVRGKQQRTPWVRAQSDDPYSRQLAGHLCTTTRCPPVSSCLPTASRALSNELLTSLIGLSQRGLQLVWSLSSHNQRRRHQLFVSNAFSKRSHPSSSCPPTAARPLINELLTTRASCPRRGLWPGLALFSHNPRRQRQRLLADALFKRSCRSQWPSGAQFHYPGTSGYS